MNAEIQQIAINRVIRRLCHFTPARNLAHIAAGEVGVLATRHLLADELAVFTATDPLRLDGYADHVCASVEYPNAYYLKKAQADEVIFLDWVVLIIRPDYLWHDSTLFCPRNAAAGCGRFVTSGTEGFRSLYADSVEGSGGRTFFRSIDHLPSCPTDLQAEILVPDLIRFDDVIAVAVRNETQARNEVSRLRYAGVPDGLYQFVIAPGLFDGYSLSSLIRKGRRPAEKVWRPPSTSTNQP